jgi:hypothetical protein
MSARRSLTVAAMHLRDLSRRRLALAILILLPLAFYFSASGSATWVIAAGAIGASWSVAVAALFVMVGSKRADQPLLLAGYTSTELLVGRVVTVLGLVAVITPLFTLLIRLQNEVDVGLLFGSMVLSNLAAVALGVLSAALVPREMEGVLIIIGVIGIQMSGDGGRLMPLWGSTQMLQRANGATDMAAVGASVAHSLIYTAVLFAVAVLIWARRVRLWTPSTLLPTGRLDRDRA